MSNSVALQNEVASEVVAFTPVRCQPMGKTRNERVADALNGADMATRLTLARVLKGQAAKANLSALADTGPELAAKFVLSGRYDSVVKTLAALTGKTFWMDKKEDFAMQTRVVQSFLANMDAEGKGWVTDGKTGLQKPNTERAGYMAAVSYLAELQSHIDVILAARAAKRAAIEAQNAAE